MTFFGPFNFNKRWSKLQGKTQQTQKHPTWPSRALSSSLLSIEIMMMNLSNVIGLGRTVSSSRCLRRFIARREFSESAINVPINARNAPPSTSSAQSLSASSLQTSDRASPSIAGKDETMETLFRLISGNSAPSAASEPFEKFAPQGKMLFHPKSKLHQMFHWPNI